MYFFGKTTFATVSGRNIVKLVGKDSRVFTQINGTELFAQVAPGTYSYAIDEGVSETFTQLAWGFALLLTGLVLGNLN